MADECKKKCCRRSAIAKSRNNEFNYEISYIYIKYEASLQCALEEVYTWLCVILPSPQPLPSFSAVYSLLFTITCCHELPWHIIHALRLWESERGDEREIIIMRQQDI